ncbi:hypothetical protein [Edaphobacter dinghuensis]|uniref:Uncharacterized protein n=1 Tax=Edaphobacter dinghuensis TaxID=1560005 RepID=A0A917HRW0_9BACT|nr:hypothetical protein [Edaphobacter dinghuensis]GGG88506.1 hypothetical protein GCM10011585_35730 [Edaphobacter dinghuensis]
MADSIAGFRICKKLDNFAESCNILKGYFSSFGAPAKQGDAMTWREMCEADLTDCFNIEPRHMGAEIVGYEPALKIWRLLVRSRCFNSVVIESSTPKHMKRIVASGSSVFVTPDFATQELERPRPYLNSRILASIASKRSVILPESVLCGEDIHCPVDLVVLNGDYLNDSLSQDELDEVHMLLPFTFMEAHLGYRLNRILIEWTGETQRQFHHSSGVWRAVETYAQEDRGLSIMTRKDALSVSGSVAAALFQYQEPILHLHETDKHLLAESLRGGSDSELAARMNLSLASIKKRWLSLFQRVAEVQPTLVPGHREQSWSSYRGPQKRHHILSYVRSHPQEIRPFRWYSGKEL